MPPASSSPASTGSDSPARPELVLYGKPGCHLCEDALATVNLLLVAREAAGLPIPTVVERDILSNVEWEREFFLTIPVIELGGRRLELATSKAKIRALLTDVLDASGVVPTTDRPSPTAGASGSSGAAAG